MTVLIIEDETLAAEKTAALLQEIDPSIEIAGSLRSVESGSEWLMKNQHPDLIVSDVQLLDGLCFEIFSRVKVEKPVIFITAFDHYAIRAFEVHSIDYLLKPVQKEKLEQSLAKLRLRNQQPSPLSFENVLTYLKAQQPEYKSRFMVRIGQRIMAIPVENIAYFSSESKLTFIVTTDNKRYPFDLPLDEVDQQLDPKIFFRINRQYIVRFSAIAEIHPYFKGRIKLKLNPDQAQEIVVSSERTPEFKRWLDR
ncbi:MAG TPA: LytTR family DNA-binding domain-containing protein [Cyclobacteriaceae bacterium]|nr:LytTR family DNA-binding domain-containing protein [Cyclobacteriaceae bacterium]